MKRYSCLLVATVCVLPGCGPGYSDNANADAGGAALRTALEFWKDGKTQDDLQKHKPSIIMNDDDWRTGKRLLEFTMDGAGSMDGRQIRWRVKAKFQDAAGKKEDRTATYIIDTTPRIVIVRDTFAS